MASLAKVLQVNEHYAPVGGTERYLNDVSVRLERRGIEIAVLYVADTPRDFRVSGREEICLNQLTGWAESDQAARIQLIRRVVEDLNPDIIQVHSFDDPGALDLLAGLRPTVQFVHTHSVKFCPGDGKFYRRSEDVCVRPFGPYCLIAPYLHRCGSQRPWRIASHYAQVRRWLRVAPKLSKLVVASDYMKRELMAVGVGADHIVVNPIGVDVKADQEGASWLPEERNTVLFVGRLYEAKGAHYLLAALEQMDVACRAVFVGDGPELGRLRQMAERLSSRHRIEFTGWISHDQVQCYYQQACIVAVPSVWPEPFGMVGVEALKYGKPVVAFDVGGVSEWLKDGENGFLVTPKDAPALAAAIRRILTDSALAEAMRRRARRLAVEQFDIERHVERMLHIYRDALSTV